MKICDKKIYQSITNEELQKLIDILEKTPEEMRIIGESYLKGDVLDDKVAAEAWLNKVIETGDNEDSFLAMQLLAREIWRKQNVISIRDYEDMKKDFEKGHIYLDILENEK